jgi:hypothetical protein
MRWALVVAVAAGCNLPEVQKVGAHVQIAADPGLTMCGNGLGHMDRFVDLLAEDLGRAPPAGHDRITYYYLREGDFAERTICTRELGGCAVGGDVYMTTTPADHELVHALTWVDGVSAVFLLEGLAFAYEGLEVDFEYADRELYLNDRIADAIEARDRGWLPGDHYPLAGAFTAFLIERYGGAAYMRVYQRLQFEDGAGLVSRALEAELGASLAELAEEFDATRRMCPPRAFKRKLIECGAPALEWDGETLTHHRTLSCEQADVVGPFASGTVLVHHTLAVPADSTYTVTAVGDATGVGGGVSNVVDLVRCGGCEGYASAQVIAGTSAEVELTTGTYALRLRGPADEATGVGVRIDRVGPAASWP